MTGSITPTRPRPMVVPTRVISPDGRTPLYRLDVDAVTVGMESAWEASWQVNPALRVLAAGRPGGAVDLYHHWTAVAMGRPIYQARWLAAAKRARRKRKRYRGG